MFRGREPRKKGNKCTPEELELELESWAPLARPAPAYLVGTGPGDPGLLTLHAMRLIESAAVVVHDRMVSDAILNLVPKKCLKVNVGKSGGDHSVEISRIHEILVKCAKVGKSTVRLQGGDPSVFGRSGPEIDYLRAHNIPVQVVPGINTPSAIAADLGFPLTDKSLGRSLSFVTFHENNYFNEQKISNDTTYAVFMSLRRSQNATRAFIRAGFSPNTPAVAVERGSTFSQRTVFAPLIHLPAKVKNLKLQTPCLFIVGEVVRLSPAWEEFSSVDQVLEGPVGGLVNRKTSDSDSDY